jgi:antitoxin component YwqK of YwqJK toxin-antitoxin module
VTIWYENGQKQSEGNCKDGKQDGLHIFYKEDGSEVGRVTFKDGEKVRD